MLRLSHAARFDNPVSSGSYASATHWHYPG